MAAQTGATLSNAAARELDAADADAKSYLALQATWKKDFHGNKSEAQARLWRCRSRCRAVRETRCCIDVFYPKCNPNILSDAKVGIHLLAGAARAAFATVLVNDPPANVRRDLETKLERPRARIWGERNPVRAGAPARGFDDMDARGICRGTVAGALRGAHEVAPF